MRRIAYISTAYDLSAAEIERPVHDANAFNAAHGITGFLLYNGRNFFQVIDGPPDQIGALIDRIEQDRRHSGVVRLIDDTEVESRVTPDWSMERVILADAVEVRRQELASALPELDTALSKLVRGFALLN